MNGDDAAADVRSALATALADTLPGWLEGQRWFADKGRGVTRVELEDALVARVEDDWLALCVVRLSFADGEQARYFLPLAVAPAMGDVATIAVMASDDVQRALIDATRTSWFGPWLLDHLMDSARSGGGQWRFSAPKSAADVLSAARAGPVKVMGAEQSNTSLRYGDALIVKLVRRLQPGANPDEEVLSALADVGFAHVPRFVGSAAWRTGDDEEFPVALAQAYVPNQGDGWSWMLDRLARVSAGEIDLERDAFAAERLLGRRTAEMHIALSAAVDPAFRPEAPDDATIAADERRTREAAAGVGDLLRERAPALPEPLRAHLPRVLGGLAATTERAEGFRQEAGVWRIRVHGDYHLGQTLRTLDDDWTIIDFEGEPARSVRERRQKTSVLKDVAGMLRSFAYARGVAEREANAADARQRLARWEAGARLAFVEAYRTALAAATLPLAPADDAAFARALAAWELDKALYEIGYEARNRPDWIALPLRALLSTDTFQLAADAEDAAPA
jgi:maltose alpha-D-glucosyltransferase/alpha-amylase